MREGALPAACCAAWLLALSGAARAQDAAGADSLSDSSSPGSQVVDPLGGSLTVQPLIGSTLPASASLAPNFAGIDPSQRLRQIASPGLTPGPTASAGSRAWTFTPSLGLNQEYDSDISGVGGSGGSLVTSIQPAVAASGQTARVRANLEYSAVGRIFEQGSDGGGRFSQNFQGDALVTVLPQTLFVDLRGDGSETPRFAGLGSSSTTTLSNDTATQNYSFSVSPYLVHRFGETGSAELGYNYDRTLQDSRNLDAADVGNQALAEGLNELGNQNLTTHDLHAAFVTGSDFGRYNGAALANGVQYGGGGVYQGAYRHVVSIDNGYAITRNITALGRFGYEDIHYGGQSPTSIHDPIWDAGVRLEPSATANLTVRYGHHDGFGSLSFDGSVQPSPRTSVYASYSAALTTALEDLQNALAASDLDQLGTPVDHSSGVPIYLGNDYSGAQSGLYKERRLSAGGQIVYDRDVVSVSFARDDRTLVSSPFAGAVALGLAASNRQTTGTITWSHQLTPLLNGVASFQGGRNSGQSRLFGDSTNIVASLSATYQVSETVIATGSYSYTRNGQNDGLSPGVTNSGEHRVLVGVSKSF